VVVVLVLGITSVALNVFGPLVLGHATDSSSPACSGRQLPAGISTAQAAADARAAANDTTATLIESQNVVPGAGVDFAALGGCCCSSSRSTSRRRCWRTCRAGCSTASCSAPSRRCAGTVEDKLHRLPLSYVDARSRGELLSRVTNDIDNVSQSLQQTMSQLLTSLLTGGRRAGDDGGDLAAARGDRAADRAAVDVDDAGDRAALAGEFVAQWRYTGELNGQIEEAFTGHELVTVFGRRGEVEETFAAKNAQLRDASYRAQFVSGIIMPSMMFLGNLNYVAVAVIGALRVATGAMTLGEGPGVHPVLPAVHPAAHPGGVHGEPAAVRGGLGRAGVRAARRPRAGTRAGETRGPCAATWPGGLRARVRSATAPTSR
jgi:ATP-binding cassette subfamily B protein